MKSLKGVKNWREGMTQTCGDDVGSILAIFFFSSGTS